ncbi:hypothetical protein [Sphingosinithalassobacter sp. LHW66-3]|uniref:hypothetical protein n=1 Tax=Sphingosinithalassobacter sp. LHW66-3 TaxID=3424718 RepID=UPI003D6A4175
MLLLAGCTATSDPAADQRAEAELQQALAGLVPGEPQRCIYSNRVNRIEGAGDAILFIEGRNRIWRSDTAGGCSALRFNDILVTESPIAGQYCAGDIARTRAPTGGQITGSCSFGEFVPYTRPGTE